MTQHAAILHAFERGARLTPMDALSRFGCMRLAARVHDMRMAGLDVRSRLVERGGKQVACYWLHRKSKASKA